MRAPDSVSPDGTIRVWRIALQPPGQRAEQAHDATLAQWLVESGRFHPMWTQWMVSLVHLRDIPGVRPASVQFEGAEHELMMLAIHPDTPCDVDSLEARGTWGKDDDESHYLTPIDQQLQWAGTTDEVAVAVAESAIRAILDGMSPDQDYRSWWKQAIASTLEHHRTGGTHMPPMPDGRA